MKTVTEKKVNLHIVRKETNADGKEELKSDVVPVTVDVDNLEDKAHGKPGIVFFIFFIAHKRCHFVLYSLIKKL